MIFPAFTLYTDVIISISSVHIHNTHVSNVKTIECERLCVMSRCQGDNIIVTKFGKGGCRNSSQWTFIWVFRMSGFSLLVREFPGG